MVCQVYIVSTSEAYISAKFGASPGKPRMFLCSYNVAGVVFKKKTDGGREGFVLLWTFPLLKCDWHKNFSNQSIPNLYPFATFAHFSLPSIHLLQRKCSWFLLPSGFCGYCKINLLDKTLEASTRVGSSIRSTQTTLEKKSVLTAHPNTRSSLCLAMATSNLVPPLRRSIKAHTCTDTHTISSCPRSWLPRYLHQPWRGKSWLKCTGEESAWSLKIRIIQYSEARWRLTAPSRGSVCESSTSFPRCSYLKTFVWRNQTRWT